MNEALLLDFSAPNGWFMGCVPVEAKNVDDGEATIISGPGPGATSEVWVFNGVESTPLLYLTTFAAWWTGGLLMAAGVARGRGERCRRMVRPTTSWRPGQRAAHL